MVLLCHNRWEELEMDIREKQVEKLTETGINRHNKYIINILYS